MITWLAYANWIATSSAPTSRTVPPAPVAAPAAASPAQKPWLDASLNADQRAQLAVKAMTQKEKLNWVMSYFGHDFGKGKRIPEALPQSAGYVPGVARLGLPALFLTDAGVGVASQSGPKVRERTSLPSGLMTSGSRGLHVVVPLNGRDDFDGVRGFAHEVAGTLAAAHPDRLTTAARKKDRGDRLYLDVQRNGYAQTAVVPQGHRPPGRTT